MGKVVIAVYRPREGMQEQLLAVVKEHLPILRGQGLVTDRPSVVMRAKDGTIVEVFEWDSMEAIERSEQRRAGNECRGTGRGRDESRRGEERKGSGERREEDGSRCRV